MKQKTIFILIWAATSVCGLRAQTEPITATEKKTPVVSDLKLSGLLISQYQYIGQEDAVTTRNRSLLRMAEVQVFPREIRTV